MKEHRLDAENKLITTTKSTSVDVGVSGNIGAATGGISGSVHRSEGSADTSFYTVSVGGGVRLNVGFGISSAGAELGVSGDVTKSAIFYCIEQLLDSGKMGKTSLLSKDVRKIAQSRKKMQKRERELLSVFGTCIEGYLKMVGAIPVSVYVDWPSLTKSGSSEEAINASVALDASLELGIPALTGMGLSVSVNTDLKIWRRPSGYMNLILEDCLPSDGLSAKDITKFLGEKYNHAETYGGKSDINVLPTILGDIRAYNAALNDLATNKSSKDAEKKKHGIEDRWCPRGLLTSEGRLGVLKTFIATAATLRESAQTNREIELFRQLNEEMGRLAKLLEFSKSKSSRNATFMTQAKARNSAINASASITIPGVGDAGFPLTRSQLRDNPFQEENGDYVQFDINLPLATTGVLGISALRKKLEECKEISGQQPAVSEYENLFRLSLVGMDVVSDTDVLLKFGIPSELASVTGTSTITVMMSRVDAPEPKIYPVRILSSDGVPESSGEVRPLPNETLVEKNKNEWVIQYVKVTSYLNTSVNAPKFVSFTSSIGKDDRVIGTDTMTYLTARFNAFSLGLQYSKDAMSPWNFLKKKQSARFVELFKNMTMQDKNIRYELQNMYNTIMDNVMDVDSKTGEKVENDKSRKCTQTFADFLKACKIIASETDGKAQKQAFQDASKLLDDIFRMNFEYNFMFDYNKAYKIDVR